MLKSTVKWCEDNLVLDGEPFSRDAWPAMCMILDEIDRRRGCVFLLAGSIQSWKSFAAVLWDNASFHLRASKAGWYAPTVDLLKRFASSKFNSLYEDCVLHRKIEPMDRNKIQTYEKTFPHMPFSMLSAHTQTHRQSLTLQTIVCDEAWMYEPGELSEIRGRLTAAEKSKLWRMIIPTSCWDEGSEVDLIWKQSDQRVGHLKCPNPACGEYFAADPYRPEPIESIDEKTGKSSLYYPPGGLHYLTDDSVRDANGLIHKDKFAATATYQCPHCAEHMDSMPHDTLTFIAQNPEASRDTVAWMWTALCHMSLQFVAYQKAVAEEALSKGDPNPIEEFDRKRAMRPWNPMRLYKEVSLDKNMGNYGWEEEWDEEYVRFLKIDVQQGFYWWSVHLWSQRTHCRLLACGMAWNDSELREIQLKYKVHDHGGVIDFNRKTGGYWLPNGCGVVIDGNYDTARVRRLAATYHWIVLRGQPEERRYKHRDGKYRIWNEIAAIEAFTGDTNTSEFARKADKYVAEIQYSAAAARGILRTLKSVTEPAPIYSYPKDVSVHSADYLEHQKAWQYRWKKKGPNTEERVGEWVQVKAHDDLEWCERANIVLASTVGLIGADAVEGEGESGNEE